MSRWDNLVKRHGDRTEPAGKPPHLQQWLKDAETLEIPRNIQKGLLFFVGIDLLVNGAPVAPEHLPILGGRMTHYMPLTPERPSLPADMGLNLEISAIIGLLHELALQHDPHFLPAASVLKHPGKPLPRLKSPKMADGAEVARAFYAQVGDGIGESDPEAIIVGGFKFIDACSRVDAEKAKAMCRYALALRPPHMRWISRVFLFEKEHLPEPNSVERVMNAFFEEEHEQHNVAYSLYFTCKEGIDSDPDPAREKVIRMCPAIARRWIANLVSPEPLRPGADAIRAAGNHTLFQIDEQAATEDMLADIAEEWGYTDLADISTFYLGERLDRLCCVLMSSARDAVLRVLYPEPHKLLPPTKPVDEQSEESPDHLDRVLWRWKAQAEVMGLPVSVQKGLLFLLGAEQALTVSSESDYLVALQEKMENAPDIPDNRCAKCNDEAITGLLLELALRHDPDFTPEEITLSSGHTFTPIRAYPSPGLPPLGAGKLADITTVALAFYEQVGNQIEDSDPASIFWSGIRFFEYHYWGDTENAVVMFNYALETRPPHMLLISMNLAVDTEQFGSDFFIYVLNCFFKMNKNYYGAYAPIFSVVQVYYNTIHPVLSSAVEMDFARLRRSSLRAPVEILSHHVPEDIRRCAEAFRKLGDFPLFKDTEEGGLEQLDAEIREQWGYTDLADDIMDLPAGQRLDRICCLLTATVRDATLKLTREFAR